MKGCKHRHTAEVQAGDVVVSGWVCWQACASMSDGQLHVQRAVAAAAIAAAVCADAAVHAVAARLRTQVMTCHAAPLPWALQLHIPICQQGLDVGLAQGSKVSCAAAVGLRHHLICVHRVLLAASCLMVRGVVLSGRFE